MVIFSILLLILGICFLMVELFIPGFGIFGVLGIIFVLSSWAIDIFLFKFGILIVLSQIVILSLLFIFLIKKLKNMQIYNKFILSDIVQNEKNNIGNIETFIGREGFSKTDLKPFGYAEFNGVVLDVVSDDGYIKKNSSIKIIKIDENKLYVKLVNSN